MKGIILAGGTGSRLMPCTLVTNKHLLPVYDQPMIYYPIKTLVAGGIDEILIVAGKGHAGDFLELLGSGRDFKAHFSYAVQTEAGGIAQALSLAEDFADNGNITVILGDNIFEHNIKASVDKFESNSGGAKVFLKKVDNANRFGVAEIIDDKIISIEEKPNHPKSDLAVTGLYMYDNLVWKAIKNIKPSGRGELEITDVNNFYIRLGKMSYELIDGFWSDAGTFESLYKSADFIRDIREKNQKV